MFDIYVIENVQNGKKYVGYTSKGYRNRFKLHIKEASEGSSRYLCRAIRKYGADKFTIQLLDNADNHEEAKQLEIKYIDELNCFAHKKGSHGYNATIGGEGMNGFLVSKETREKISKLKKEQQAWVGSRNPKFQKGHLISGSNHPMFGRAHSDSSRMRISASRTGQAKGGLNPAAVKEVCFSLECETGIIEKFDTFYDLRESFLKRGTTLNRSAILGIMRKGYGRLTYKGYTFFREDVTPIEVFEDIRSKFEQSICEPITIASHKSGKEHHNAKNMLCFAENLSSQQIYCFDSWFNLKIGLEAMTGKRMIYSNMLRVLDGRNKYIAGFKLYRQDVTEVETFESIRKRFNEQTEPSTIS